MISYRSAFAFRSSARARFAASRSRVQNYRRIVSFPQQKISMKYVVNWIPLRIRVRSRNTQPHLNMKTTTTTTVKENSFHIFCFKRYICTRIKHTFQLHPKTLIENAMVLPTNSGSFPSNSHVSATFSILLRFGEFWNPTNCEKFNAYGSLMGRTNLDKSVW